MRILCAVSLAIGALWTRESTARELTFEDRVKAQYAIEQVYWNHRIWPNANSKPKPALSEVLPDSAIRARIHDYLKKSNALDKWWHRPINGDQLQAEMERMKAGTHDGAMLRELFAALGDDPFIIAETLARQTLVDRLVHSWYANDGRFHGVVKRQAEHALAACQGVSCMKSMGGAYTETTWRLDPMAHVSKPGDETAESAITLTRGEWTEHLNHLAASVGGTITALPVLKLGRMEETSDAFVVTAVLSQGTDELKTATVTWTKIPFDTWWHGAAATIESSVPVSAGSFAPVEPSLDGCVNDTWSRTVIQAPDPRFWHTAVWTGSQMIVWGGLNIVPINSGGVYTPATDSWTSTSVGANVPAAREQHTAIWTGTEMIVWGGFDSSFSTLNTGGRYNPSTDSWTPTSVGLNVPSARAEHTAVWANGQMIVWGGVPDSAATAGVNSGGRYDPSTDSWSATSTGTNVPTGRAGHVAVWTGAEMIVWGADANGIAPGGRYNPATDTWTPTSIGPDAEYYSTSMSGIWTGTEMIVWGGTVTGIGYGGRYNPSSDSWVETSRGANAPAGRYYHVAVWTGTQMVIWGGYGPQSVDVNSGGRYDPATDTWLTTQSGMNDPAARSGATAVSTNSEMIVWGGATTSSNIAFNTGGRYNPTTNSWVPTSTGTSVPRPRQSLSSLWTGTEMIVWGGDTGGSPTSAGGRYNPSLDSWTATASVGAPTARANHSAVWTGNEMVVWGGGNLAGSYLSTGGKYNPATDSWTATATGTNCPSGRQSHSAVWASNQMIVWGGDDGTVSYRGDGGRYDPSNNTWLQPPATTNAPVGRRRHSAVWTGSKMIVWGGDNGTELPSGGIYDLASDSWTATSIGTNVPTAREFHSAIWTGSKMIVWGGSANGSPFSTGGSLDPTSNTWTATSTGANVPSARDGHAAVWTSNEMIVWGGKHPDGNLTSFERTGARYNPTSDTWTPITADPGNPGFLGDPRGVWADSTSQMIVWGGYPSNNGGLYCASCFMATWYRDQDGDGYGDAAVAQTSCTQPAGYVALSGDCNDANPAFHPGATELCNGIDDDCNGQIDDGYVPQTTHCGVGACARSGSTSCVNGQIQDSCTPGPPAQFDNSCNNIDDNCNGQVDEQYPTTADGWNFTSTMGAAPSPRTEFVAVSTGTTMIVWSGIEVGLLNDGAIYTPATNSWAAMTTNNAPTRRKDSAGVWTGTEMIVWGGDDGAFLATGGRYNPATNSWAATSGPPIVGRSLHTAVWATNVARVLIWGGHVTTMSETNTGASYNPVTNTWTTMATGNAPMARFNHTATWTGSKMIIWGGENSNGGAMADGKIYDPTTDTWANISTAFAPSARTRHSAVWTGTRMIVFGGYSGSVPLTDGASYDPVTNTWTPIASILPLDGRYRHAAIWDSTDNLMLVWGGAAFSVLNDGARYNPATNSWTTMAHTSLTPRERPAGFWFGNVNQAVVWGGDNAFGSVYNDGGRYVVTPFNCGLGPCTRQSSSTCTAGVVGYGCTPGPPSPETCNQIDDDCDGTVDNNVGGTPGTPCLQEQKGSGLATTSSLKWTAIPGALSYDVIRGSLSTLRSTAGNYTPATLACLANDTTTTSVTEFSDPPTNDALFHLFRANFSGGPGTYDESSPKQIGLRDAEIAASPNACP